MGRHIYFHLTHCRNPDAFYVTHCRNPGLERSGNSRILIIPAVKVEHPIRVMVAGKPEASCCEMMSSSILRSEHQRASTKNTGVGTDPPRCLSQSHPGSEKSEGGVNSRNNIQPLVSALEVWASRSLSFLSALPARTGCCFLPCPWRCHRSARNSPSAVTAAVSKPSSGLIRSVWSPGTAIVPIVPCVRMSTWLCQRRTFASTWPNPWKKRRPSIFGGLRQRSDTFARPVVRTS